MVLVYSVVSNVVDRTSSNVFPRFRILICFRCRSTFPRYTFSFHFNISYSWVYPIFEVEMFPSRHRYCLGYLVAHIHQLGRTFLTNRYGFNKAPVANWITRRIIFWLFDTLCAQGNIIRWFPIVYLTTMPSSHYWVHPL